MSEVFQHNECRVEIFPDDDVENPRQSFDHLAKMACWHRRYNLGDEQPKFPAAEWLRTLPKGTVRLPLFLMDHGGTSISTGSYHAPWDSGQVGWIYVTPEVIRKEWKVKRISKKLRAKVEELMRAEVQEYDQWMTGDVWGFKVTAPNGKEESCWGFYGHKWAVEEAKSVAEHLNRQLALPLPVETRQNA